MTCETCSGYGVVRVNWLDAPDDYAVCLCPAGVTLRRTKNGQRTVSPLWQVWATRNRVPFDRVVLLEDVLTAEELSERGFVLTDKAAVDEAALIALGKSRPRR